MILATEGCKAKVTPRNQNLIEERSLRRKSRRNVMRKKPIVATRKANMYFNHLVGTKRAKYKLTFLVATIGFFLITIFSAVLITWEMTLANILMMNKTIYINIIIDSDLATKYRYIIIIMKSSYKYKYIQCSNLIAS